MHSQISHLWSKYGFGSWAYHIKSADSMFIEYVFNHLNNLEAVWMIGLSCLDTFDLISRR